MLLVEDDRPTRRLLDRVLREHGLEVTGCETAEEALEQMTTTHFPFIFLDIHLPGMNGYEFASTVRTSVNGDAHYILVGTANSRPEDLRRILAAGADDYISKPYHPGLLSIRLAVAQSAITGIERRKALEEQLRHLASHDPLTGLLNRTILSQRLEETLLLARSGRPGTVLYLDLDNFKIINDTLGHDVGDELLVSVAEHLKAFAREEDTVVRFGGDEFVIVLPGVQTRQAQQLAESVITTIERIACAGGERVLHVGASIGLAPVDGTCTTRQVMAFADEACYAAKAGGRNRVEVYNDRTGAIARLVADTDWSSRIRSAMRDGSLGIHFQPIVAVQTGVCLAQELLLRYSEGPTVSPRVFLDALRRAGQMVALDRFVIARAFDALALNPELAVSINISGQLFADPEYVAFVERMIRDSGIAPTRILFEITEDEMITNLQAASGAVRRLQSVGCRFALDDFGAGFSSLAYLRELPIDILKMDGSFTRGIASKPFHSAVLRGIKTMTDALGIETVAEAVETREEFEVVRAAGMDYVQGYLFAQPRPTPFSRAELAQLIKDAQRPPALATPDPGGSIAPVG